MTVTAKYQIDAKQIEDMAMTVAMTMKVSEWRNFIRNLPLGYEKNYVGQAVSEMLGEVTKASSQQFKYPQDAG